MTDLLSYVYVTDKVLGLTYYKVLWCLFYALINVTHRLYAEINN